MNSTQIAELEAEYLRRARDEEEAGDRLNASTWKLAAALLIEAASPGPVDPCPGLSTLRPPPTVRRATFTGSAAITPAPAPMNPPDNLPPLPPVPMICGCCDQPWYDGVDRDCKRPTCDFKKLARIEAVREPAKCDHCGGSNIVDNCAMCGAPQCCHDCCAETTREIIESAKDQPPFPGAKSDSIEGLANLDHFVSKAFTKSFTVGGNESAKDEACPKCGAERTYYDGWNCPTEGCDLPAKEPTGVEARVCEDALRAAKAIENGTPRIPGTTMFRKLTAEEVAAIIEREIPARVCEDGWRPIEQAARDLLTASRLVRSVISEWCPQGQHPRTTMDFGRFQTAIENMEALLPPPAERSDHE